MIRGYMEQWWELWNRFWFIPRAVDTLAIMRILVGSLLFYTHAVWTIDLATFFSGDTIIPADYRAVLGVRTGFAWSHFDWIVSPVWMWSSHIAALIVLALFTVGFWTRATSIAAFLIVVSYANRATGALFGLDQINAFLTLYLAISNCGAKYSIDHWISQRKGQGRAVATVANNIATRLMQLHICIVYLFAGLGKLQGASWWNGEAVWGTIASYEYQTLDLTWMSGCMWLVNIMTYVAVSWEFSYAFLIWPKLTRPIVLSIAVLIHLGIGLGMGMLTFGLIMLCGNLAFIRPEIMQKVIGRLRRTPNVQ